MKIQTKRKVEGLNGDFVCGLSRCGLKGIPMKERRWLVICRLSSAWRRISSQVSGRTNFRLALNPVLTMTVLENVLISAQFAGLGIDVRRAGFILQLPGLANYLLIVFMTLF